MIMLFSPMRTTVLDRKFSKDNNHIFLYSTNIYWASKKGRKLLRVGHRTVNKRDKSLYSWWFYGESQALYKQLELNIYNWFKNCKEKDKLLYSKSLTQYNIYA